MPRGKIGRSSLEAWQVTSLCLRPRNFCDLDIISIPGFNGSAGDVHAILGVFLIFEVVRVSSVARELLREGATRVVGGQTIFIICINTIKR
jgi:uncharacterized membrane protein